ncbi:PIR protein [Plasmodium vivax]|uniref:VIR protein n=1 Tax=Plasmodium vivax TaxID=5855 RepID=A0A565A1C3_PLAVI|nr:PIR protein [Plasmodium vivax]
MDDSVVEKATNFLKTDVNSHFFVERTSYANYSERGNTLTYYYILNVNVMANLENSGECEDCQTCNPFIQKICCNLAQIAKNWEQNCSAFNLSSINCNDYFIYWLYGKIKESKSNNKEINCLYRKLKSSWKCKPLDNTCVKKYSHIEDINVLKNKKELYDFTEYYSAIKSVLTRKNTSNKNTYCEYINYIFHLYEKIHKGYYAFYSGYYDKDIKHFKTIFSNVKDELQFLGDKCPTVNVNLVLDKASNSIKQIKQGVYKDFVKENSKDLQDVDKDDEIKNSPLHKFYSKLNESYFVDISKSAELNPDNDKYFKNNAEFLKIWEQIQKILKVWENELVRNNNLSSNQKCEYFNYWLYDKLKDNIEPPKVIPFLYRISELLNKEKQCKSKKYEFHIEQIPNKKRLHDFVENYEIIKGKLNKTEKKENYCKYIKAFFNLYKHMEQDKNGLQGYRDEIIHFKSKFYENVSELNFLNNKCPGKCLKYIFTNNYKENCSLEEQSKQGGREGDKICLFENNPTVPYGLIPRDSEIYKKYEEFSQEYNSEYYKTYCTKLSTSKCRDKGVDKICLKLVKNLIHLSGMPRNNKRDEHCYLLKHWLYDEIRKIFGNSSYDVSKEPVIDELKEVVYRINNYYLHDQPCYCDFVGTLKTWKEEKELHDYFQSYDKIESNINADSGKCDKFLKNIVAINKLYEEHFGECCYCYRSGDCYDSCPGYFKCDEKYDPYNIFVKLGCNEEISKNFKKVNKPQGIDNYVISETIKSILLALKSKFDLFDFVTLSVLGILGTLMIFFIFYKFTPLGRASHKKGYSNEITMNNLRENFERELAQSTPRNVNGRGNAKRIRIAYQTA